VVRHLPLVREAIERLGIHRIVDQLLPIDTQRMRVSDADCLTLMITNLLHGRVALYRMDRWLGSTDVGVVLGEDCPADAFGDARLGSTLDRIFAYGADDILSEVATAWLQSDHSPDAYSVHADTTSVRLYGAYEVEADPEAPTPAHGHSKDHRPDLKQLIYGLNLQGAVGIPLCFSFLDGNTPDSLANRFHLDRLAGILPPQDEVTFVMDCKLFDPRSLGHVYDAAFHFVTLMPRSYALRSELVEWAVAQQGEFPELARAPGRTRSHQDRVYRGISTIRPFTIDGPDTGKQVVDMRFLVVESSQLAAAFEAGLEDKLLRDRERASKAVAKLSKRVFTCSQDATDAMNRLKKPAYHRITTAVVEETQTLKRTRPGRPRKGEMAPTRTVYRVVLQDIAVDQDKVDKARLHARFFVLATDHTDSAQWPDDKILAEYRHQYTVEGHTGFRWLKGPAAVAPMFLKKPERIAALGLIFVLALMVRNYIQWRLRSQLQINNETLPNMNNQHNQRPTTESAFRLFQHIVVILVEVGGKIVQRLLQGIDEHVLHVLDLLDMPLSIYTQPRRKPG